MAEQHRFHMAKAMQAIAPHHNSVKDLWELKWKRPCQMGVYPFMEGKLEDFEPIFEDMIKRGLREPYDQDEWAKPFLAKGIELEQRAESSDSPGELWRRATALYRIARQPVICSESGREAWNRGVMAHNRAAALYEHPEQEVTIPHIHGLSHEGQEIKALLRMTDNKAPVLMWISGLDGYRIDMAQMTEQHIKQGFNVLVLDIPGTADSPADPRDSKSPDRLWSSVLDWLEQKQLGPVFARGVSTGGYYAMRLAHTHAQRLKGVVAHGGGCHYMFTPEWIDAQDNMEYPFGLSDALMRKFGYVDKNTWKKEAGTFSLLSSGILDKDCCPLLLINGIEDTIFPIEDNYLLLAHGKPKHVRFFEDKGHMADPDAEKPINEWLYAFLSQPSATDPV